MHHHGGNCAHGTSDKRRLLLAFVIITIFMVVEVVGGLISGSLALLADAGHMATDAGALLLALMAKWLAERKTDMDRFPFGLQRAQVLAGFLNGVGLLILVAWLIWESMNRIFNPEEIMAGVMLGVAIVGLGANIAAFFILHGGNTRDLNMRGAILHVVGDILGSAAAIISAVIIWLTNWVLVDALLTIAVSILIVRSALPLLNEAARVLLQGAPDDFKSEEMIVTLKTKVPEIQDIHELSIWMLTPEEPRLSMHIKVGGAEKAQGVLQGVKAILADDYDINYSTIQIECPDCPDENIFHDDHGGEETDNPSPEDVNGHFKSFQRASA